MPSDAGQAGATPASDTGATPGQSGQASQAGATPDPSTATPPATPAPAAAATGSPDDTLGEGGKRALADERKRAATAEKERDELRKRLEALEEAGKSENEKALAAARKEGAAEAQTKADARIRRAEVRAALTAAGISATELDLAAMAADFAELKVAETGDVTGLADAVTAFKAAHPGLFAKPAAPGTADGGARGGSALTLEQIKRMSADEINSRWDEVQAVMAKG